MTSSRSPMHWAQPEFDAAGWSMGALILMDVARRHPGRLRSVSLIERRPGTVPGPGGGTGLAEPLDLAVDTPGSTTQGSVTPGCRTSSTNTNPRPWCRRRSLPAADPTRRPRGTWTSRGRVTGAHWRALTMPTVLVRAPADQRRADRSGPGGCRTTGEVNPSITVVEMHGQRSLLGPGGPADHRGGQRLARRSSNSTATALGPRAPATMIANVIPEVCSPSAERPDLRRSRAARSRRRRRRNHVQLTWPAVGRDPVSRPQPIPAGIPYRPGHHGWRPAAAVTRSAGPQPESPFRPPGWQPTATAGSSAPAADHDLGHGGRGNTEATMAPAARMVADPDHRAMNDGATAVNRPITRTPRTRRWRRRRTPTGSPAAGRRWKPMCHWVAVSPASQMATTATGTSTMCTANASCRGASARTAPAFTSSGPSPSLAILATVATAGARLRQGGGADSMIATVAVPGEDAGRQSRHQAADE